MQSVTKARAKEKRDWKRRSCGCINWNVRGFWTVRLLSPVSAVSEIKGKEWENANARKGKYMPVIREVQNWIGFLLIKILNLTPECAVFNETASASLSLFSRVSGWQSQIGRLGGKKRRNRVIRLGRSNVCESASIHEEKPILHLTLSRR